VPIVVFITGLAVGVVFVRRQRRLADPLPDLGLFADRSFSITLTGMLMYSMLSGGTMVFVAQFFQLVAGLSPLRAGLALLPGSAAGAAQTGNEFGYALGIATLGSVGTAVYHGQMTDGAPAAVRESIASAVTAAQRLPGQAGADLLERAQRAFTSGVHAVALVSAVLLAVLAVVILTWLDPAPVCERISPRPAVRGRGWSAVLRGGRRAARSVRRRPGRGRPFRRCRRSAAGAPMPGRRR
jgi:hypothetical protein